MFHTQSRDWTTDNAAANNRIPRYQEIGADNGDDAVPHVMIIDNDPSILKIIRRILKKACFKSASACNAEEARSLFQSHPYDLVLCDIGLPGESGLSFIRWLAGTHPETSIIMVTGYDDMDITGQALKDGAHGYVIKPLTNHDLLISIAGALENRKKQIRSNDYTSRLQKEIELRTRELADSNKLLKQTMHGIIKAMATALEFRDPYTVGHQHHERVDGSGYPLGLKEGQLTIEARIITVADVVEAMASQRPYRPALKIESALSEIRANQEHYYSADVVDACLALFENDEYRLSGTPAAAAG